MNVDQGLPIAVGLGWVQAYLLRADGGWVLVDAGSPGQGPAIERRLARRGIPVHDLRLIIVTHAHADHTGGIKHLVEASGADVLAHSSEVDYLASGESAPVSGLTPVGRLAAALMRDTATGTRSAPVRPTVIVESEATLEPFGIRGRVLPTPGHTAGSISVLLESGEACVGDLCVNWPPVVGRPGLPPFGDDADLVRRSWRAVIAAGARTICPAHGAPFAVSALAKALGPAA